MPIVACPSCGEKGKIPDQFVGTRVKCKKCGTGFLVTAPTAKAPTPAGAAAPTAAPATPLTGNEIQVEGLDDSAWTAPAVATSEHDHHDHDEATASFTPHHAEPTSTAAAGHGAIKQYKVLSSKDKYFEGKFDLARLEEALNHFASQGWVVRAVSTPHVAGFQGEREELVIFLER